MARIIKVGISVPTEGHTVPEAMDSLMLLCMRLSKLETESKLLKKDTQFQFFFQSMGRLFTPMAREKLAEACIENGMDYMLFLDDDMIIPPDTFEKLFRHEKDIVAALAFTRNAPHDPVIYQCKEGYENGREYFVNLPVINYPKNQLMQCDAVGFGTVLIKMSVYENMAKPYFMSTSPTGEDILFCYNAGKAGAKVFVDTSICVAHLGAPKIVTEKTFEDYHKDRKEKKGPYKAKEEYEKV